MATLDKEGFHIVHKSRTALSFPEILPLSAKFEVPEASEGSSIKSEVEDALPIKQLKCKNRGPGWRLMHQKKKERDMPFTLPPCSTLFAYSQKWQAPSTEAGSSIKEKSPSEELSEEGSLPKELNMTAMTDLHPRYFSELKGRPVQKKFSLFTYRDESRKLLRNKIIAGLERDDSIRMEHHAAEEAKRLEKAQDEYRRCVAALEEFLAQDHHESMLVLKVADKEAQKTAAVKEEKKRLTRELDQMRLQVYNWDEEWKMVQRCRAFLHDISPSSWRHRYQNEPLDSPPANSKHQPDSAAQEMVMIARTSSLESLIDTFLRESSAIANEPGSTELYFQEPEDLIQVFRTIEVQNLNALIHLESLVEPMAEMNATIRATDKRIQDELGEIKDTIKELEVSIEEEERRAAELEKHANNLLQGVFRDLVCSEDVLYARILVEDAYESCVAPNDANMDSFAMMKAIERVYEELNSELDSLPHDIVEACRQEVYQQESKKMREAEEAAQKYDLMQLLLAALRRIMQPPKPKTKPLMFRSQVKIPKEKPAPPPLPPTAEELEFIKFFTDKDHLDANDVPLSNLLLRLKTNT